MKKDDKISDNFLSLYSLTPSSRGMRFDKNTGFLLREDTNGYSETFECKIIDDKVIPVAVQRTTSDGSLIKWKVTDFTRGNLSQKEIMQIPEDAVSSEFSVPYRRPPKCIHDSVPKIPPDTLLNGLSGTAVVEVLVDKEGNVEQVEIVDSNSKACEKPVIDAAKQWKFMPAQDLNGNNVEFRLIRTITFNSHR